MTKGLEALESIKQTIRLKNDGYINLFETLDFLSVEKELKALEIIKEKEVDIMSFKRRLEIGWDYNLFEEHCLDNNEYEENPSYRSHITQEEYDLLREVLK